MTADDLTAALAWLRRIQDIAAGPISAHALHLDAYMAQLAHDRRQALRQRDDALVALARHTALTGAVGNLADHILAQLDDGPGAQLEAALVELRPSPHPRQEVPA